MWLRKTKLLKSKYEILLCRFYTIKKRPELGAVP